MRFRVPDILLLPIPSSDRLIVRTATLLCVEILSSEDRMRRIEERVADYLSIGVRTTWIIDPWRRTAFVTGPNGQLHEIRDTLSVPETSISVAVDAIFSELDRLEARSATPTAS